MAMLAGFLLIKRCYPTVRCTCYNFSKKNSKFQLENNKFLVPTSPKKPLAAWQLFQQKVKAQLRSSSSSQRPDNS